MNKPSNREVEQAEARNTGKKLRKARKAENKKRRSKTKETGNTNKVT